MLHRKNPFQPASRQAKHTAMRPTPSDTPMPAAKDPLLTALGQRVKTLRARRGMPRRVLALTANISERHIANLESGAGNISILVLQQIAHALDTSLPELLGDDASSTPEWLMIRKILEGRDTQALQKAHQALTELFTARAPSERTDRIAFIGLRGAGKSTLGRLIAARLNREFIELRAEVTRLAGAPVAEIQALYGSTTFRRYERQALEETIKTHKTCVIATAGGLASDPSSLHLLLSNCFTIWLQATPEEHLDRVIAQGDLRPPADRKTAVEDLNLVLESRAPFYARADFTYNTSGRTLDDTLAGLMGILAQYGVVGG
jgi:XRE family aerobic/anaerobic benzoate catabolism transcriptional regulator